MKRNLICKVNGWEGNNVFPTKVYREHEHYYTRLVCLIEIPGHPKVVTEAYTEWVADANNEFYK